MRRIVAREVTKAVDIWQRGIQRDLATAVGELISKDVDAQVKAAKAVSDAVAPAPDGEAAAPEGEAPVLDRASTRRPSSRGRFFLFHSPAGWPGFSFSGSAPN